MRIAHTHLSDGTTVLPVAIDDATLAWLIEVADLSHTTPEVLIAAILRDVREDDRACDPPPLLQVVGGTDTLN